MPQDSSHNASFNRGMFGPSGVYLVILPLLRAGRIGIREEILVLIVNWTLFLNYLVSVPWNYFVCLLLAARCHWRPLYLGASGICILVSGCAFYFNFIECYPHLLLTSLWSFFRSFTLSLSFIYLLIRFYIPLPPSTAIHFFQTTLLQILQSN